MTNGTLQFLALSKWLVELSTTYCITVGGFLIGGLYDKD